MRGTSVLESVLSSVLDREVLDREVLDREVLDREVLDRERARQSVLDCVLVST